MSQGGFVLLHAHLDVDTQEGLAKLDTEEQEGQVSKANEISRAAWRTHDTDTVP